MSSKCLSQSETKNVDFKPSYQCKTCKKRFKKFIYFEGHFAFNAFCRARNGWFMQCYVCRQRFHYLADLNYHLRRHINKRTETKQTVNRSTKNKRKNESTAALMCQRTKDYVNDTKVLYAKKTATTHESSMNGEASSIATVNTLTSSSLKCQTFKIECSDSVALEKHKTTHTNGKIKCDECNQLFTTEVSLKFHQKLFHQCSGTNKPKGNNAPELQCDICNAKFTYSHNLTRHKLVHTIGKEECEICHIKFTRTSLKLHEREAHSEVVDDNVPDERRDNGQQYDETTPQITTNVTPPITPSKITSHVNREVTPPITSPSSSLPPQITYVCERSDKSVSSLHRLHHHLKTHRQYSCKICEKKLYTVAGLRSHYRSHTFECYVCKNDFRSAKTLMAHIIKHTVYEQWVDPINVYLSNWNPEESREILQNQPLVLVENLDINKLNLNCSVGCDTRTAIEMVNVKDETKDSSDQAPSSIIEQIKRENETEVSSNTNGALPSSEVEGSQPLDQVTSGQVNIELKYSEQSDLEQIYNNKENIKKIQRKLSDCVIDQASSDENDELLIVEQQHDITTTYDDVNNDVIDISSESDVDDITELFHCYFCQEHFRSLYALGVHVKKCSFCP